MGIKILLFRSHIDLLMSCLLDLAGTDRGILKTLAVRVDLFIFSFQYFNALFPRFLLI